MVSIINDGGLASSDVRISIDAEHDEFWDNVRSDGFDVRFVNGSNFVETYKRTTWDYANKSAVFELNGITFLGVANEVNVRWMYWGNANAADGASLPTIGTTIPGVVHLGRPQGAIYQAQLPRPGATTPLDEFGKTTTDEMLIWCDLSDILEKSSTPLNGHNGWEAPHSLVMDVQQGGVSQAGLFDAARCRFVELAPGEIYVGLFVKGGTDANDYTIVPRIQTTHIHVLSTENYYRELYPRALLRVNDVNES